jgi:hypothetical protein
MTIAQGPPPAGISRTTHNTLPHAALDNSQFMRRRVSSAGKGAIVGAMAGLIVGSIGAGVAAAGPGDDDGSTMIIRSTVILATAGALLGYFFFGERK